MFEKGSNVSQFATMMQNKDMKFAEKILIFCKQPLKASYASFIPLVFKEKGRIRILHCIHVTQEMIKMVFKINIIIINNISPSNSTN